MLPGYLLALLIGATLGVLGGGGSLLTVPVLVYVLGYDPKLAITMSLPVVGATSLAGAVAHWRAGNVRWGTALAFGAVAMSSAFGAARLSVRLGGRTQLLVLGIAMLASAAVMLRDGSVEPAVTTTPVRYPFAVLILASLLVGALTGVVGVGGGFLIVPALVVLLHVPMRQAVGTSLAVITMNAAAGLAGQPRLTEIPFRFVITFTGVAIAGVIAGARGAHHVPQRTLKRMFAVLLLAVAAGVFRQVHSSW